MKKHLLPSFMCLFLCLSSMLHAQNPNPDWESVEFPKVIFTEYRGTNQQTSYFEITNTEDTAVDLSSFRLVAGHYGTYDEFSPQERWLERGFWRGSIDLVGKTLEAGKSMVFGNVFDKAINAQNPTTPKSNFNLISKLDWPIFYTDNTIPDIPFINQPEFLTFDFDSVTTDINELRMLEPVAGRISLGLLYKYEHLDTLALTTTDSLIADVVNLWTVPGTLDAGGESNVAGIEGATRYYTLVRKSGSAPIADWDIARGVSSEDSYWMVVPNPPGNLLYTTVGNHGDYSISMEANTSTSASIDKDNKIISVPWESVRGDSVIVKCIEFGKGMAWEFIKDSIDNEDSAYVRVQDGDLLKVYAFGESLQSETYTFKPLDAPADLAIARSKVPHHNGAWRNTGYFTVTTSEPVMDSILNISNQLRIDTLMTYIEIPPHATSEIIFIDNNSDRIDLKDGDLLRVTSENKEVVKDYYLQVNEYVQSDNTALASITWPDYDTDDFFDWAYLRKDTLPEFNPSKFMYKLTLPADYVNIPALFATAADLNAQLHIDRATNLKGTAEERTTTFTITSESDTLTSTYQVIFELDLGDAIQLTDIDPFISEKIGLRNLFDQHIELFNPNNGTEALNMSRYMIVVTKYWVDINSAIESYSPSSPTSVNNHKFYIPGYKFNYNKGGVEDDPTNWGWKNGLVGGITPDPNVVSDVAPGDVFVISNWNTEDSRECDMNGTPTAEISDINLRNNPDFPNITLLSHGVTNFSWNDAYYLYEILNDSILEGTKGIWESNSDYRIIDIMSLEGIDSIAGSGFWQQTTLLRKASIQKGNTTSGDGGAFHAKVDSSEFYNYGRHAKINQDWKIGSQEMGQWLGYHVMDPITSHISTITSNAYQVNLGYEGNLNIKGDMPNVTVSEFIANLNKADTGQYINIKRAETVLTANEIIASGDVTVVTSADSSNTTNYTIEAAALNNDVTLTAVGDLGIIVNNEDLSVSGFSYDQTIADILAGVECHELSTINIIDANDNLVSLLTRSLDTALVEPMIATKVFNGLYFEVVAEDGTIAKYELIAEASSSEAYLTSNVFTVSQEENNKYVSGVSGGYSVSTFLNLLTPSGKATLELRDKTGVERTYGALQIDDYVAVVSEDGMYTAKYAINFYSEEEPDVISSIKHQNINRSIKLYPNPTSSLLNIENVKVGSVVQVISLNGSMVYTNVVNNDRCTIDMSRMNSGVYIVRMVEKEGASVFRVLKN